MSPIKLILVSMIPLTLMASANKPVPPAGVVDRQIELEYEAKEVDAEKQIPLLEIDIPEKKFDMGDEKALINTVQYGDFFADFEKAAEEVHGKGRLHERNL
jgi:hypothetical protein